QWPAFTVAGLGRESSAIGGAEDRSPAHQQTIECMIIKGAKLPRLQQSFVAAQDAEGFPAAHGGSLGHRTDDGVQTWTIAPAGHNADAFTHRIKSLIPVTMMILTSQSQLFQLVRWTLLTIVAGIT